MKKIILLCMVLWFGGAQAASTLYLVRVDGMACPYCAYGVEKSLKKISGVVSVGVDLDAGLVRIVVREGVELGEEQLARLFEDAGFSYRSMRKTTTMECVESADPVSAPCL